MDEAIFEFYLAIFGIAAFVTCLRAITRRGRKCHYYPDFCPTCPFAAECIIEMSQKEDEKRERRDDDQ